MVQFNFFRREVNCKIVYYGPGLSGKTTCLEFVHRKVPPASNIDDGDLPVRGSIGLGIPVITNPSIVIAQMAVKFRLFTIPGQVYYNSTRKLILQGADGIIFVADSQKKKLQENLDLLKNLEENLAEHDMNIMDLPLVMQWNKRDMSDVLEIAELENQINYLNAPSFESIACTGQGVFPALGECISLTVESVNKKAKEASRPTSKPLKILKRPAPPFRYKLPLEKPPLFKKFREFIQKDNLGSDDNT